MSTSEFLAQVIGLYLVITNLAMLIHQNRWKKMVNDCLTNAPLIAFTGSVSLLLGILIVVSHNVWVSHWPIVITLTGWIAILNGAFRLFLPNHHVKITRDLIANQGFLLLSWAWLIIGVYLIWAGFTQ